MVNAIEIDDVTRVFTVKGQQIRALDGVSACVPEGQIVALLGENGAGKTTLTKILSTMLFPTTGHARIFGADVVTQSKAARQDTATVFGDDRGLYTMLSGYENLRYFGVINGIAPKDLRARIPALLDDVGLGDAAHRKVDTYSKGMKQRLHVAVGLLVKPRLMLLDEPTVGIDPIESESIRATILELAKTGTTVLLTSHNLLDADRLADRVIMISKGRFTHDLPLAQFRAITGLEAVVTVTLAGQPPREIPVPKWSAEVLDDIRAQLAGHDLVGFEVRPSTLEDAFTLAARQ